MISYSKRTLGQVVDEVFIRAATQINSENLDWNTVVHYANQAVKEISLLAYHHKQWAYIKRDQVTFYNTGFNINRNMIKVIRMLFTENADFTPPFVEGRFADPREYYIVARTPAEGVIPHSWNRYTNKTPIYTIWGSRSAWVAGDHIGESYSSVYYSPSTMYGLLEYYAIPEDVINEDDKLPIPYEFEDYITLSCLYRLFSRIGTPELASPLYKRLGMERNAILKIFEKGKILEKRELDNFADAVMPMGDKQQ